MKEIIEEILMEEKKASQRVAETQEKAKQIRIRAEDRAREIVSSAREKSQEEGREKIALAERKAQEQKKIELEKAVEAGQILWEGKNLDMDRIVDRLFKMVIGEDTK